MEQNDNKQERTLKNQSKVLECLAESGNISYACKRAGINRDTFYTWKKEDKLFAENADLAVSYGKSFVNDLAHTQLIRLIQDGDMRAVRFQLISCHEDYKPRRARPPEETEEETLPPITSITIVTAKPRDPVPSPAPSAPPLEHNDNDPKKLTSPSTKPESLPEANGEFEPPHPRRRRGWNNDDDGFLVDSSWIWPRR